MRDHSSGHLSNYFWTLKKGGPLPKCLVIPTPFTWFGCKYIQIKAQSLHLKHILFHFKSIVAVYTAKLWKLSQCPDIYGPNCTCGQASSKGYGLFTQFRLCISFLWSGKWQESDNENTQDVYKMLNVMTWCLLFWIKDKPASVRAGS